jgi:hypothetical protein
MSTVTPLDPSLRREQALLRLMAERYVPVALRGLERSLTDGGAWLCFKALPGAGDGELVLEGRSERYTAMSLIGLTAQAARGRSADVPIDRLLASLCAWAPTTPELGDAGLVLWLLLMRKDARAEALATAILARRDEVLRPNYVPPSMEFAYLLIGVSEAVRCGVGGDAMRKLADAVAERLALNQDERTQLFSFAAKARRKNFLRSRVDTRLGSFASQVYPTIGFAFHARATGDSRSSRIARTCADRICALQGESGQWWWVYNVVRGGPASRYPVYSVHQHGMGPMMLCAAEIGGGHDPRYDAAIEKSFAWFDRRPELPGAAMIDASRGMIWRAIQHDDPRTTERLGLSTAEITRMSRSAWFGGLDERPLEGTAGFVCGECRPYELGWMLLAEGMYADCVAARALRR